MDVLLTVVGIAIGLVVGVVVGIAYGRRRRLGDDAPAGDVVGATPTRRLQEPPAAPDHSVELLDHHRDAIVLANARGSIVHRNAAARRLQGTHVGVLVDEAIDTHVADALRDGHAARTIEMYGPPKVVLDVAAHRLHDGGVVVFVDDISERRRVDQVRTDFVANISHELKTPIGAMAVLADAVEGETDLETIHRVVGRMIDEAQRAARTIDDLMELSRIEVGGERTVEPVDVAELLAGATDRVTELASQRGIGVTNLTPVDRLASLSIEGDRRQLVSALGNLVENAVKYSEEGGQVQLRVRADDDAVEIAVVDQGVGIPQRDLDRIFERFYRVDRARSRVTGGTGLGLSIVRHVVEQHGGTVRVDSIEGEGSTFTLRLPMARDRRGEVGDAEDESTIRTDIETNEGIA